MAELDGPRWLRPSGFRPQIPELTTARQHLNHPACPTRLPILARVTSESDGPMPFDLMKPSERSLRQWRGT